MAEDETVAVRRAKPELAHPPGLVARRFQYLGAGSYCPPVKRVHVVDVQVGHIAVVAQLSGCRNVWAAAEHECRAARAAEAPVTGCDIIEFAAEDVVIPGPGELQVMNREYRIGPDDAHGRLRRGALASDAFENVVVASRGDHRLCGGRRQLRHTARSLP